MSIVKCILIWQRGRFVVTSLLLLMIPSLTACAGTVSQSITKGDLETSIPTLIPSSTVFLKSTASSTPKQIIYPTITPTSSPKTVILPTVTATITPSLDWRGQLAILGAEDSLSDVRPYQFDIYLMNSDGEMTRLTEGAIADDLDWSPDGNKIVFSALYNSHDGFKIYTINADGSGFTNIRPVLDLYSDESEPAWSPDGQRIAFSQFFGGVFKIYIMDVDGKNTRFLTEGGAPSWSPDGKFITFVRRLPDINSGNIFVIGVDGQGLRQLTKDIYANVPKWSPDGKHIAFVGYYPKGKAGIYMMDVDGSNRFLLKYTMNRPSWSLNGKYVTYPSEHALFMANINGEDTWLISSKYHFYFKYAVWRPGSP
jgi:Tol biopolymer transport system component